MEFPKNVVDNERSYCKVTLSHLASEKLDKYFAKPLD